MQQVKDINCNLIDRRKLVIGRQIGSGSFGVARLGNFLILNNKYKYICVYQKCAIKELYEDGGNNEELMDEITRMSYFNHANIIEIYGYSFEEETFTKGSKLIMVMEYCENGSLNKRLKKDPKLSPKKMLNFSIQIANGMCYLASKGFVHRDLAARNILLTNDEQTVKIADFGLSRFLNEKHYYSAKENTRCPILWMPPEFWEDQKEFGKAKRFSTKSDVWGFGVTMWEMFSYGKRPWEGQEDEVMNLVLKGKILEMPQDCPLKIWEVIKWCWTYDYKNRPNFENLKLKLDQIEKEFEATVVPVMNSGSGLNSKSIDSSNCVETSPINITQKTAKLNTCQSTPCHSSSINLEVDENVESESEGFDVSPNNICRPDLEGNNLLDINNDSKRLLKRHMAIYDKDPKYRCLCGIHVRKASLVLSIITLLSCVAIIIKPLIDSVKGNTNTKYFEAENIYVLVTCVVAPIMVSILFGEKFKLPQLYLPYLFISALCLLFSVVLLLYQIFILPVALTGSEVQEFFKKWEEWGIKQKGYQYTILFFSFVLEILTYLISVYIWFMIFRAYQYLCILKEVEWRLRRIF